jgi:hypothetical protein
MPIYTFRYAPGGRRPVDFEIQAEESFTAMLRANQYVYGCELISDPTKLIPGSELELIDEREEHEEDDPPTPRGGLYHGGSSFMK